MDGASARFPFPGRVPADMPCPKLVSTSRGASAILVWELPVAAVSGWLLNPADLRRAFGSLVASHVPFRELKALMGHSSIRTTERYYLAVGDDVADRVRPAFSITAPA